MSSVPAIRLVEENSLPVRTDRELVLYWMTAQRRAHGNFALAHAAALARELGRPLVVLEALRAAYPWASARLHRFVIEGMRDNRADFAESGITYLPYVEPAAGDGSGLLTTLAEQACVIVTDDYPCFFLPRMRAAAAQRVDVHMVAVDGCGLLPLRALPATDDGPRRFRRAVDFRRHLQRELPPHLVLPETVDGGGPELSDNGRTHLRRCAERWPTADLDALLAPGGLDALPIDHGVAAVAETPGGAREAATRLETFIAERLNSYGRRTAPDVRATSALSPYLHFGHIGPHQILEAIAVEHDWSPDGLPDTGRGSRSGWWGLPEGAESFLDQVVTWRELCFHTCHVLPHTYDRWESLPDWARATLLNHALDPRPALYDFAALDRGRTHDPLWNAAQAELRESGVIHGYLRMLWGKKILEWTSDPREALRVMIALNDRYALDGRDPNSYGGILWTLGRHDRPWGPERDVFGKVRYMSSENTTRKLKTATYVERWSEPA